MKFSIYLLAIFTSPFIFYCCSEPSKEQVNHSVEFQGLWESVDTGNNLPFGTIQIESSKDSLHGNISYVFANSSAASKRGDSGQPFQGLITGDSASLTIFRAQNQSVGNAEIKIVNDTLIYSVKATGIEFPEQRFVKRSAQATKAVFEEVNNDARWDSFRNKGIDFVATGNEPFWSIEVDFEGKIKFTSLSQPELFEVPMPKPEYPAGGTIVRYFSKTEAGMIDVVIQQMPCVDNMSGVESPAFVTIKVKVGENHIINSEGCGRFLGDARLNGNWKLKRIGEKNLDEKKFSQGLPNMEIDLNQGKLWGTGGCNKYSSSFEVGNGHLAVGQLMATKMACDMLGIETEFLQILSGQQLRYGGSGKELMLQSRSGKLMFERIADN
jgi:heat shock protein HslJ